MTYTRRQFFQGRWLEKNQTENRGVGQSENSSAQSIKELPSDFSPALLAMQAKLMGFSAENMTGDEMAAAVLDALNSQQRPAGSTEEETEPESRRASASDS